MREFNDAEKQQLQAKIKDEQERQHQTVKEIALRNEEASKSGTSTALSYFWKYGFLVIILCLLAFNVIILLLWWDFVYDRYANLVVALALLFNHIVFYLTKIGWPSRVMKTIACIWIVFALAYILWVLSVQFA